MAYQQLTLEKRSIIYVFCKAGFSNNQNAQEIERYKSTIGRELRRDKGIKEEVLCKDGQAAPYHTLKYGLLTGYKTSSRI